VSQVKVAEHILTGHKVAIKILNRRKISAMDMEEKGAQQKCDVEKANTFYGLVSPPSCR
jgi:hypothetical protein